MSKPLNFTDDEDDNGSSVFGSQHGNLAPAVTEDEKLELAKKESRWVLYLRLLTGLVLVAVAITVCFVVYFEGRSAEKADFENDFSDLGEKLVSSFESDVKQRLGILDNLAMSLTSEVETTPNVTWPFFTPASYEQRGGSAAQLGGFWAINLIHIVRANQLQQWNMYARANKGWREESMAVQLGGGLRAEDINMRPISPVLLNYSAPPPKPAANASFYCPFWTQAPVVNSSLPNVDYYSSVNAGRPGVDAILVGERPIFLKYFDYWGIPEEIALEDDTYRALSRRKSVNYQGDPFSAIHYPIMKTLDPNKPKELAAFFYAGIYWRTYFDGLLPPGANGIDIVLQSTCNEPFTYQVNGVESVPVGPGDLHDSQYDYLAVHSSVDSVLELEALPVHLRKSSCSFTISAYPSQQFEDSYQTDAPWIFAVVLACLFVFTSAVFVLYDYTVEQRQKVVLKSAQQSGQLVQSLYPKAALDKMYQEQDEKAKQNDAKTGFLNQNTDGSGSNITGDSTVAGYQPKEAIASLYPETSIFFADLAGFTKWSSKRTPEEVFQLLEALYGEYDKIAKRRRIFKVETIGDCYVAATGIPAPQADHAVTMCKFAADCMTKMNTMAADLAESMGEDTLDLAMRVGIHSGPVTAGVLRGEKARFQLFGDTVNTASRMESNGVKGRIQVSQSTADALKAQGKETWLTPREDKIEAKGKGHMQTYFVEVSRRARSLMSSMSAGTESFNQGSTAAPEQATRAMQDISPELMVTFQESREMEASNEPMEQSPKTEDVLTQVEV